MKLLRYVMPGAAAVGATYALSLWPRMASWGTTEAEARAPMPGDELIAHARYRSTHAVTIDAPADAVWPWLVQLGQGRGGLYSYDWLENLLGLDIHSANTVEAQLQSLTVGDTVRLVPGGTEPPLRFIVARVEAPYVLVLGPDRDRLAAFAAHLPHPCWTFQLTPAATGQCRLVVRFQTDFRPTPAAYLAYGLALQPVHFVMERKMLLGIKQRAELPTHPAPQLTPVPA